MERSWGLDRPAEERLAAEIARLVGVGTTGVAMAVKGWKREIITTGIGYVIFMCHLSVEKALKALVNLGKGQIPPKTHDLKVLARTT